MQKKSVKKIKAPIDLFFCIVAKGQSDKVLQLLTTIHSFNSTVLLGHGTANSNIADLFGFGMEEREVIFSFINASKSVKFLKFVNKTMGFDAQKHSGIAFTINLSSMENNALEYISSPFRKEGEE